MASKKITIYLVAGARPNFMKIAPLMKAMRANKRIKPVLIHTGQHYDRNMSKTFFDELEIPKPDYNLGIGSGTHAQQTANVMLKFEKLVMRKRPDYVLVVGDVNSTVACSLVASKLLIPVIHVEAGLRSFNREMPEELNRIVTDGLSDLLFVTEKSGRDNLIKEGTARDKIHFVGNVMIDTLLNNLTKARDSKILETLQLQPREYGVVTIHRPSNVDDDKNLKKYVELLLRMQKKLPLVFPVHPRTNQRIQKSGLAKKVKSAQNLILVEPLGYLDFLKLMSASRLVLTDSGGIQEETTILKVPCLTMREDTERPVTITEGTNILVGTNPNNIYKNFNKVLRSKKAGKRPRFWDGHAAERIVKTILIDAKKRS